MNPLVASTASEFGTRGQNFLRNYPGVQDKGFLVDWESDAVPMPVVGNPNWGEKYDPGFTVASNDTSRNFTSVEMPAYEHQVDHRFGDAVPVEMPAYEHQVDHRFGDAVPVPMPEYKQRVNLLNPVKWLEGIIQSTREQVQGGGYAPEGPPVSPVDQTFRGLSDRNRRLEEMMNDAGG